MPLDIYSTRAQLAAIDLMPREYTFLYDHFVQDMGAVEDTKAIYDYRKGVRQMAPIVHEESGGVLMSRQGYETREIGFCWIAPERIITNPDIVGRAFGEAILGAMTPEQRAKKMLAKDLTEMRQAIQRRREWMARQVLLTGKLEVFRYTNEGKDKVTTKYADYDFTNYYTPLVAWDQPGSDILYDMEAMYDKVFDGLGVPEIILMAPDVAHILVNNERYMKFFDMKNVEMGEINTRYRGQGVRFYGYNSDGVEMYSYAGKFTDDDGTIQPCLPKGTLIMGSRNMLRCPHGPVTQVEGEGANAEHRTYIKKEVPRRYGSEQGNAVKNRLTSCPTIIPVNIDGWVVGKVTTL